MKWRFIIAFVISLIGFSLQAHAESLQDQIDKTPAGGTLKLFDRVYREQATISKPITIIGSEKTLMKAGYDNTVLTIENTKDVTLENLNFARSKSAIDVKKSSQIKIKDIKMIYMFSGVTIRNSTGITVDNFFMRGLDGQYASKGTGIAAYDSKKINISNSSITEVLDAYYLERVTGSRILNNKATYSRYGLHYMYGKDIYARDNLLENNVTGIMLMIAENALLEKNTIQYQSDWNSSGFTLYDAENIVTKNNKLIGNRTAISSQNMKKSTIKNNVFLTNQTAVEFTGSEKDNTVENNDFLGNILNIRSDGTSSDITSNFYDDYSGFDVDEDNYGDEKYVALQSFGQWMVREPAYQYFTESPSVVLLNQMDQQTNKTETNQLVDNKPLMKAISEQKNEHSVNIWLIIVGAIIFIGGLYGWRRSIRI
ncbi:MAG: right-handed parallel beta-helix repeat-containing protein [Kurthia sp.]|nr:right-handed parallel beta-helix repeat-containing protein [Candidatus Kurthia equi]